MILFFYGPNTFAARRKLQETVDRFKNTTGNSFDLERFDCSDQDLSKDKVVSAISSVPFLATNRLVILEDMLANKKLGEALLPLLKDVAKETVVVIYESKVDERTKLFKELKGLAKSHKFENLTEQQLRTWVLKTAESMNGKIDAQAVSFLIERVGNSQWRLWNELQKLTAYNRTISKENITELVEPTFENSIFDMVEEIAHGQATQALRLYLGLRHQKAQPLYILSMIAWQMRNLLLVKAASENTGSDLAQAKISPYVVSKVRNIAVKVDMRNIVKSYESIQETDLKLKTLQIDSDVEMQQLILRITSLMRPARSAVKF